MNEGAGPLVRLEDVSRRFGDLMAVDRLSLEVHRGEMFGLIGPDGAGKTTTLRMVLGILSPGSGVVETCGLSPTRQRRRLADRVGYLSQKFSLYGDLSVDENIAVFAEIHAVRNWQPRRDALLDMVRMTPFRDRLAARLSGGMKQKLALVCTLVHTPELLVLDEPSTGVDPVSRRDFWKLLSRLRREGLTILLTTPYLDEAERCGRVALMDKGRLLTLDAPGNLRSQVEGSFLEIVARPRKQAVERLREHPEVGSVEVFGDRLHVNLPGVESGSAPEAARRLADHLTGSGVTVESARPGLPSLEDVFIRRIRATTADPNEVTQ